jgi:hypothetical protein
MTQAKKLYCYYPAHQATECLNTRLYRRGGEGIHNRNAVDAFYYRRTGNQELAQRYQLPIACNSSYRCRQELHHETLI